MKKRLLENKVVSKVLRIPEDDTFGVTRAFLTATTPENEISECFSSHAFFRAHSDGTVGNVFKSCMFRLRPKASGNRKSDDTLDYLKAMRDGVMTQEKKTKENLTGRPKS